MMTIPKNYPAVIFSKLEEITVSKEVSQLITELVGYTANIFGIASDDAISFFYGILSPKIKSHEIANLQPNDTKVPFIQQCAKWAIDNWVQCTKDANIQKSILCYSLLEYLHIPDKYLEWNQLETTYVNKIELVLPKMDFTMVIPDDAPNSEKIAYQEFLRDVENDKFKNVISFMDHMWTYKGLNIFMSSLIKIAFRICPHSYALLLGASSKKPLFVKALVEVVDDINMLDFFVTRYNEKAVFPLVYFFDAKVKKDNKLIERKELSESEQRIDELCSVLGKIIDRLTFPSPVKFLMNNLNLSMNNYYHLILGNYLAQNVKYAEEFSDTIDFGLSQSTGTYLWQGFTAKAACQEALVTIALIIETKYYTYCRNKQFLRPNQYSGYLNFMYKAIQIRCSSLEAYCRELTQTTSILTNMIVGWNFAEIPLTLHKLFISITANAVLLHHFAKDACFSDILEFMSDHRLKAVLSEQVFALLNECLTKPTEVSTILASDDMGKVIELRINPKQG